MIILDKPFPQNCGECPLSRDATCMADNRDIDDCYGERPDWCPLIDRDTMNHGGVYECFHCLSRSVVWDCDYTFDDFGYDGDGIVQMCHCENCGAEIEYRIPFESEEDDDDISQG